MGRFSLITVAALLILGPLLQAKPSVDPEQAAFAKLSGRELVQLLADGQKRSRAFYELLRRAEPEKYPDFEEFDREHSNPRLVICPQEGSRPPLSLVLSVSRESETVSRREYRIDSATELFPPPVQGAAPEPEPTIDVFTYEGRVVDPFGGNNILESKETLADINGDELVERTESMLQGVEGVHHATVLKVLVVKPKATPLLTVVINWEDDEWTFRLTDRDGDRISDVEAGPRTADGLVPKAVWKWDRAKRAYVGPTGTTGDHFRVIDGARLWKELNRLKASKLTFPKDPDAVEAYSSLVEPSPTPPSAALPVEPYHFTSLKSASDAELLRYMAQGKSEWDRQTETTYRSHLPDNFWNMDGKAAALALVEANRTDAHRARYQIAIDDRDKAEPPARCTITFSTASARCYEAVDGHYFLRVDPDESYLAFAGAWSAGVVPYNAVYDQPVFDLRICPLSYEEARKISQVIWWLDRVRSRELFSSNTTERIVSSGDGSGHVVLRVGDRAAIDYANTLWGSLASRWADNYRPETFVNFAGYLLANALPARLGQKWSQFEPTEQRPNEIRQDSAAVYTDAERKRLQDFSERFLGWFSPQQERISFSIVSVAAQFAGDFGIVSDASRLREIEAALPPPAPPKRTYKEIEAEKSKLPPTYEIKDPRKRKRIEEREAALDAESDAVLYDDVSGSPDLLRKALATSLRQLAAVTDPTRLSALAVSSADEGQWALRYLGRLDQKRYADALETLTRKTAGKWARQFFAALAQVDHARAATIARELPANKIDALTIPAFGVLRDAGAVPDEPQRLAIIIKMLHNPKTDWLERAHAIEALVPLDDALRYPGWEIDEALLKLFAPDQADESGTFTLEEACLALARRGRTETFDRIVSQLAPVRGKGNYDRVLEALTYLAQRDSKRFNPQLVEIIRPHLAHTNESIPRLIWMIWGADLRELQPELERLATANPDEFEDIKASTSGGNPSAVTGRFHLARKTLSLWNEPDSLTRAKLLIAFCASQAEYFFRNPQPERVARMKMDLSGLAGELSPDDMNVVREFIRAIDSNPDSVNDGTVDSEMVRKATTLARTELRL